MVHFVYETTNIINGKFYRGKHSTKNLLDGYIGSGKLLKRSINKYGTSNFTCEILYFCDSEDDAYELEELIITQEDVNNPMCYNVALGGNGVMTGRHHTEESKKKISANNARNSPWTNKKMSDETRRKMSEAHTGKKRTGASLKNIQDAQTKLGAIERTCPYCGKHGKGNAMLQWHFENCKFKKTKFLTKEKHKC